MGAERRGGDGGLRVSLSVGDDQRPTAVQRPPPCPLPLVCPFSLFPCPCPCPVSRPMIYHLRKESMMRRLIYVGLILTVLTGVVRLAAQQRPARAVAYEGARLIIGDTSAPIESGVLVVQDGRIT